MTWDDLKRAQLAAELEELDRQGLQRVLRTLDSAQAPHISLDGRQVVNLSANNYLGLAAHPAIRQAARGAIDEWGVGSAASRLIVGNTRLHDQLERRLAQFHQTPDAVLFNSGYHANLGVIGGLVGNGDLIFSDALNHASIIDGCRLSRATVLVYPHRDLVGLEGLLREHSRHSGRRLIVTESVFSMDGDRADLVALARLAGQYQCWLMVDEAHAIGVVGSHGQGLAAALGLQSAVDILVGTLGKAIGSFGGYAAGGAEVCALFRQRARSFVFTTALPAPIVAASIAGLDLLEGAEGERRRAQLWRHIADMDAGLVSLGIRERSSEQMSAIFPILVGDASQTMGICEELFERGLHIQGIRPPTVPRGTSRLRLTLMATHSDGDLQRVMGALTDLVATGRLQPAP